MRAGTATSLLVIFFALTSQADIDICGADTDAGEITERASATESASAPEGAAQVQNADNSESVVILSPTRFEPLLLLLLGLILLAVATGIKLLLSQKPKHRPNTL